MKQLKDMYIIYHENNYLVWNGKEHAKGGVYVEMICDVAEVQKRMDKRFPLFKEQDWLSTIFHIGLRYKRISAENLIKAIVQYEEK